MKAKWIFLNAVIIIMMAVMGMTAQAEEEKQFVSFTLGGNASDTTRTGTITYSDNSVDSITFTKWDDEDELPSENGNYYLDADVNLFGKWEVPRNQSAPVETRLCLNGHKITQNVDEPVIYCEDGSRLSLFDCGTSGVITHAENKTGSGMYVTARAVVSMYGGKITGNTGNGFSPAGGIHLVGAGTLNLFAGEISGNTGTAADGIYSYLGTVFNLYGGVVKDNIVIVEGNPIHIMADPGNNQYKVKLLMRNSELTYGEFATGWTQIMGNADPSHNFIPNISGWIIARKETGLAIYRAATGVTIDQTSLDLSAGGQMAKLTATIAPKTGVNPIVKWSVEGSDLQFYSDRYEEEPLDLSKETTITTVYVKGTTAGSATITATATNGTDSTSDDKTATCSATVHEAHEHNDRKFEPWMSTTSLPSHGSYYLTADVTLSEPLAISGNSEMMSDLSICLNGHKIIQSANGAVITNGAHSALAVFDCGTTGEITHAEGKNGSGVTVSGDGSGFVMYGGKITGNSTSSGGGVSLSNNGLFKMCGGSITGNNAENGGGVYVGETSVCVIEGGTISNNTATGYGGGLYLDGTQNYINVKETATIIGNTSGNNASNVYLNNGCMIRVTGDFDKDASIGVTMKNPGVFSVAIPSEAETNVRNVFSSDEDKYLVDVSDGSARLAAAHTMLFDAETSGGVNYDYDSITVVEGATIDLDPNNYCVEKEGWDFLGWNTIPTATSALDQIEIGTEDVTVYAIFSKELKGTFYSGSNEAETVSTTIYNAATEGTITAPALKAKGDWTPVGWNTSDSAYEGIIAANAAVSLSSDTSYYGIYSCPITVSYESNGGDSTPSAQSGTRYLNVHAADSYQNPRFTLAAAITRSGFDFEKWHVGSVSSTTVFSAGQTDVELEENSILYAGWVQWSQAAAPVFTPVAGTYPDTQSVMISSTTEGADIYYTTNKKNPTTSDTKYTGAITVSTDMTIRAIAVKSRMRDSEIAEAVYEIRVPNESTGTSDFVQEDPSSSFTGLDDTPQDNGKSLSQQLNEIALRDNTSLDHDQVKNVQVSLEASSKEDLTEVGEGGLSEEQRAVRAQQTAILTEVNNQIPDSDKSETKTDYMELTVNKIVTKFQIGEGNHYTVVDSSTEVLSDVVQVLEIPVKYDMTGHGNLIVTRIHNNVVQVFQRLDARPAAFTDGTFYVEGRGRDAIIYIYSQYFSLYSVTKYGPKEQAAVAQAPTEKILTYNGTYQQLINGGTADKGNMLYAIGTDETTAPADGWSREIPSAKEAGVYYVWYKAGEDENYTDSSPRCIVVTIKESTSIPALTPTPTSDPTPTATPTPSTTPAPASAPKSTPETESTHAPAPIPTASVIQEPITISIAPSSVKAKAKKNKVTVSWKKIKKNKAGKKLLKKIKSIQVQYSTDKKFKKNVKTKSVGKKKTKITLKLKKKKTYYIRVRYKGTKGNSKWSAVKKVKTKK